MGIRILSSDTSGFGSDYPRPEGNPNPYRFKVLQKKLIGKSVVVFVNYPDCKNYEGDKILVFKNEKDFNANVSIGTLDPHFSQTHPSPIARFEPTKNGWKLACKFARIL